VRVAKGVALGRSCASGACYHRWGTVLEATIVVQRAVRRGTRLVAGKDLATWSAEARQAAQPRAPNARERVRRPGRPR
jgi:hypothetical protein